MAVAPRDREAQRRALCTASDIGYHANKRHRA